MLLDGRDADAGKLIGEQFFSGSPLLKARWLAHRGKPIGLTCGQPEARISVSDTAVWPKSDENTYSPWGLELPSVWPSLRRRAD